MDTPQADQMVILSIRKVAADARLKAASAALAEAPGCADLIAAERRARQDADYAARKSDELLEQHLEDARREAKWLHEAAKSGTEKIFLWLLIPAFLALFGTGPFGAFFGQKTTSSLQISQKAMSLRGFQS
jgi:hypothetical protein